MNILEISYLSQPIADRPVSGNPVKLERTWTDFLPITNYFPNVIFLGSSNVGSAPLKRMGESLPGAHGINHVYSPLQQTQKTFNFLVRSTTSEANTREIIKNFVTWLYSIGEVHISFNNETQMRRFIYNSGSDYEIINGIYGYDAQFSITLTCLDSLSYSKEYKTITGITATVTSQYRRVYNIINNTETIDYTPLVMTHTVTSTLPLYQGTYMTTIDRDNFYYISFTIPQELLVTPYTVTIDGENSVISITNPSRTVDLLQYVRVERAGGNTINYMLGNYASSYFPYVMSGNTYFAYYYTSSTSSFNFKYRPRKLAYD